MLEWDELWSFVGAKEEPAWVWVALERAATGYTDFGEADPAVLPQAQPVATGKATGQTAPIER